MTNDPLREKSLESPGRIEVIDEDLEPSGMRNFIPGMTEEPDEDGEIVLPKNYQRPPPLGGKVPDPDTNPLYEELPDPNNRGQPGKSLTAVVSPKGGANLEKRKNQLMQ